MSGVQRAPGMAKAMYDSMASSLTGAGRVVWCVCVCVCVWCLMCLCVHLSVGCGECSVAVRSMQPTHACANQTRVMQSPLCVQILGQTIIMLHSVFPPKTLVWPGKANWFVMLVCCS
jgi:hypothetical protein